MECALKACIAKTMRPEEFPDKTFTDKCWTHNLPQLVVVAWLKEEFEIALKADPDLADKWVTVKDWSESSRYAHIPKRDAEDLYAAITDKRHGVFPWLKLRW